MGVFRGGRFEAGLGTNSLYFPLCLQDLLPQSPSQMSLPSPGQASMKQACDWC